MTYSINVNLAAIFFRPMLFWFAANGSYHAGAARRRSPSGKKQKAPVELQKADFSGRDILLAEDNEMNRIIAEEILSEFGFAAAIPIIAVKAKAFEEDRIPALGAGMKGHLSKPCDIPKMLEPRAN